jgi:hypothetical protein
MPLEEHLKALEKRPNGGWRSADKARLGDGRLH